MFTGKQPSSLRFTTSTSFLLHIPPSCRHVAVCIRQFICSKPDVGDAAPVFVSLSKFTSNSLDKHLVLVFQLNLIDVSTLRVFIPNLSGRVLHVNTSMQTEQQRSVCRLTADAVTRMWSSGFPTSSRRVKVKNIWALIGSDKLTWLESNKNLLSEAKRRVNPKESCRSTAAGLKPKCKFGVRWRKRNNVFKTNKRGQLEFDCVNIMQTLLLLSEFFFRDAVTKKVANKKWRMYKIRN